MEPISLQTHFWDTTSATQDQASHEIIFSEASVKLIQELGKLLKKRANEKILKQEFKKLSPSSLTQVLKSFLKENIAEINLPSEHFISTLAASLDIEPLQEGLKEKIPNLLKEARSQLGIAKYHLEHLAQKTQHSFASRLKKIFDSLLVIFDSILISYGVTDLFKPAEDSFDSHMKVQNMMMLSMMFSGLASLTVPLFGPLIGGLAVGAALILLVAISLIWPRIKPLPAVLPVTSENISQQVLQRPFEIEGRKETLDKIADILKMNKHPILVGPSRVGKTLTSLAFVNAVFKGEYPELKKLTFFGMNTSELLSNREFSSFGGGTSLAKICKAIEYNEDKVCLILDEIHNAGKEKLAERLKTLLDEKGKFRHVIGITTKIEFDQCIKPNPAFSARFVEVEIVSTDQEETEKILSDAILKSPVQPMVSSVNYLYKKATQNSNLPQPMTAITLLKKCINKVSDTQKPALEAKICQVTIKINSLKAQMAATRGKDQSILAAIEELEQKLTQYQDKLALQKKEVASLYASKKLYDQLYVKQSQTIIKISKVGQNLLKKDPYHLKVYALLSQFLLPLLEKYLQKQSQKLGIDLFIDEQLIDQVSEK